MYFCFCTQNWRFFEKIKKSLTKQVLEIWIFSQRIWASRRTGCFSWILVNSCASEQTIWGICIVWPVELWGQGNNPPRQPNGQKVPVRPKNGVWWMKVTWVRSRFTKKVSKKGEKAKNTKAKPKSVPKEKVIVIINLYNNNIVI